MEKDKRISSYLFYQPFDRKCQLTAVNISAPVGQTIGYREALSLETRKSPETVLTPGETWTQHTVYRFSAK